MGAAGDRTRRQVVHVLPAARQRHRRARRRFAIRPLQRSARPSARLAEGALERHRPDRVDRRRRPGLSLLGQPAPLRRQTERRHDFIFRPNRPVPQDTRLPGRTVVLQAQRTLLPCIRLHLLPRGDWICDVRRAVRPVGIQGPHNGPHAEDTRQPSRHNRLQGQELLLRSQLRHPPPLHRYAPRTAQRLRAGDGIPRGRHDPGIAVLQIRQVDADRAVRSIPPRRSRDDGVGLRAEDASRRLARTAAKPNRLWRRRWRIHPRQRRGLRRRRGGDDAIHQAARAWRLD